MTPRTKKLIWLVCILSACVYLALALRGQKIFGTIALLFLTGAWLATRDKRQEDGALSQGMRWLAWAGLVATIIGDTCLVTLNARIGEMTFIVGVAGFATAQSLWILALGIGRPIPWRSIVGWSIALCTFVNVRLLPVLPPSLAFAIFIYALTTSLLQSVCWRSRSIAWIAGCTLLLVSDVLIAYSSMLGAPKTDRWIGPLYILSLIAFAFGICTDFRLPKIRIDIRAALGASMALLFFIIGGYCASTPSAWYNPLRQMLSYLGRSRIGDVLYPPCHYWFMAGMFASTAITTSVFHEIAQRTSNRIAAFFIDWGGMLNATGLAVIALVPENVKMNVHNYGCDMAVVGGFFAVITLTCQRRSHWIWFVLFSLTTAIFIAFLYAIARKILPFSPYLPTAQKALILLFMGWLMRICIREAQSKS